MQISKLSLLFCQYRHCFRVLHTTTVDFTCAQTMRLSQRDLRFLAKEVGLTPEKRDEIVRILKEDGE